ncbi:MAG: thiamine pyrophosphate-dependent enzyme, partial [Candidatus Geothermarchaeales archaeon]
PGACHIEVPQDVSQATAKAKPLGIQETQPTKAPRREIERALEVIRGSKYPLVLAGSAAVRGRASKELRRLAHRGNIPVASTFMGKGLISWRDGLSLLSVGLQMKDYVSCGLDRADVVVAAGYDFAEYPPDLWNPDGDKRIVHVDFTPAEIDSRYIPEVELVGDISSSLRALSRRVERKNVDYTKSLREFLLDELASSKNMEGVPVKPQRVMYELRRVMRRSDILVSDVGAHKLWIARLYPAYEPGTVVISNGFAAMGIALPGAIAAKLIHPDRRVLAVCGDGGFMMNSQELETTKRLDAPVVAVVMRDDAYGLIEWKEESLYVATPRISASRTPTWWPTPNPSGFTGTESRRPPI